MTPTTPLESPWRDMASAPKDGTRILLRREHPYQNTVIIGRYNDDKFARKPRPYWRTEGCLSITVDRQCEPNGWIPLPSLENASTPPPSPNELLEAAKEAHLAWCTHDKPINGFLFGRLITELDLAIRNAEQGGGG